MLNALLLAAMASTAPSTECVAAANRFMGFMIEEAKGTRHERQIRESIDKAGGMGKKIASIAIRMPSDHCAFLLIAPDSTVRALAIAALPERQGN